MLACRRVLKISLVRRDGAGEIAQIDVGLAEQVPGLAELRIDLRRRIELFLRLGELLGASRVVGLLAGGVPEDDALVLQPAGVESAGAARGSGCTAAAR